MKAALLVASLLVALPALADPWVGPGDARLRTDVELLQANGYIVGPVDQWPLPWRQIERGIERARDAGALPPHVLAAVQRIEALSLLENRGNHFEVRAAATNEAALVRTFDGVARNRGDASILASHDLGALHISWGGSWQSNGNREATRHGNGFRPDGSYLSIEPVSNWVVYGGYVDHWWGAGQDGALLFSTSARPMPQVGFRRLEPFNIDLPVLKWLGPVSFEAFAAQARERRRDFDRPAILGMRLSFQPSANFEIGFNRGLQLCGRNRPCSARMITKALIGVGDMDNTGTPDEPGNQLAGFDMSYRHVLANGHVLKLSFGTVAEDADNLIIEQFAHRLTAGLSGPFGREGALYDAGIEFTNTKAAKLLGPLQSNQVWPGSIYNNFIYTDGWTYGRRPIGYSLDGDARALTLYGALTDLRNRRWNLSLRTLVLNDSNTPSYRVSANREPILQGEAGVDWPTGIGDIRLRARLQHNAPDTPGKSPLLVQGEVGWTSRF